MTHRTNTTACPHLQLGYESLLLNNMPWERSLWHLPIDDIEIPQGAIITLEDRFPARALCPAQQRQRWGKYFTVRTNKIVSGIYSSTLTNKFGLHTSLFQVYRFRGHNLSCILSSIHFSLTTYNGVCSGSALLPSEIRRNQFHRLCHLPPGP